MDGEKIKKIVSASVVTGVVLLFILMTVLIWQLVLVARTKSQIKALQQEILVLEEERDETQDEIDLWLTEWKIEDRARELGWLSENDK